MSRKLSAEDIFDTVEVDLWGNAYTLRTITKSVSPKLDAAMKTLNDMPDDATDAKRVAGLIGTIDVLLAPVGEVQTAKALLDAQWKADKLGLDWLSAFVDALIEEAHNRRRPTSASTNGA